MLGQDAFGMELNAVDGMLGVTNAHDFALIGFGRDLQERREAIALDDEGMVARRQKRVGHAFKEALAVVLDGRGLAVHHPIIHHHAGAESVPDALVTDRKSTRLNSSHTVISYAVFCLK